MAISTANRKIYCPRRGSDCPYKISAKKICFVAMAYNEIDSPIIEKILKKAVIRAFKLKPILAKELKTLGSTELFCTKVCKPILESTYCIADVTYNNTNVGLEVGTAHGFDKPVFVTQYVPDKKNKTITSKEKRSVERLKKAGKLQYSILPLKMVSDLAGIFYIEYTNQNDLVKKLKDSMAVSS